jgi:hypothetical protein
MNTMSIAPSTKPIGEWKIGDKDYFISFALTTKPNWFRRTMANLFFGLKWTDYKTPVEEPKPTKGVKVAKTIETKRNRRSH